MLTNLKNLTNKELIEALKQYPMDATVSIESFSKRERCNAIRSNDFDNEIILSHTGFSGTNIEKLIDDPNTDIFERTEEDEDLYRACGIW